MIDKNYVIHGSVHPFSVWLAYASRYILTLICGDLKLFCNIVCINRSELTPQIYRTIHSVIWKKRMSNSGQQKPLLHSLAFWNLNEIKCLNKILALVITSHRLFIHKVCVYCIYVTIVWCSTHLWSNRPSLMTSWVILIRKILLPHRKSAWKTVTTDVCRLVNGSRNPKYPFYPNPYTVHLCSP